MDFWFAEAVKLTVSCQEIGNCPTKTPDVATGLSNIIATIIGVVGMLAVVFIIVSGLQMTLSVGNPKRYQQARMSLLYSIVGLFVAIISFAFVYFIVGRLGG